MLNFLIGLANILMVLTSFFLICLVLIQRGKGGGLAGAFGGVGGSSAFGTKAGDVFTRVTIVTAIFWFTLAIFLVYTSNMGKGNSAFGRGIESDTDTRALGSDTGKSKSTTTPAVPAPPIKDSATPGPLDPSTPPPAQPLNPANAGMKGTNPDLPPVNPTDEPAPKKP